MPIAYRSILQVAPSATLITEVDLLVNNWLASKQLPRLVESQILRVGDQQISRTDVSDSRFVARRWELKEVWAAPRDRRLRQLDNGAAVTTITIVQGNAGAWLWVDTDSPRVERDLDSGLTEIESQQAGTPRLVADFIAALAPTDGKAEPYTGVLQITVPKHVDELLSILRDDTRIGAVFVSAPPADIELDTWANRLNQIIRGTEGMAAGYVLSVDALAYLNTAVGHRHQVRPGGLRTYLPGVLPHDDADAYRHRVMAPATIIGSHPRRLGFILRAAQVTRLEASRLPSELQAADYSLLRESRRQPLSDIGAFRERSVRASTADDVSALKSLNEELVAELERQRADAMVALEETIGLIDALKDARETAEILELELEDAEGQLEDAGDAVAALRLRLRRAEAYDDANAPLVEDERTVYPDSFADLLERIKEFDFLVYVGKPAHPLQLDEHPNIRPAVHKAWDALATLNGYAGLSVAGAFDGGFTNYLNNPNHGGFNRMLNYKPAEGEVVQANPKLAAMRMAEVPGVGPVLITAHVGLLNRRARAPRLYFEDRVAQDQKVYIGYIGEHLLNAKLN
jgi:hypothetical protein